MVALNVNWLEPAPGADERPARLASPFDDVAPHPLALRCAELVKAELRRGELAPGLDTSSLYRAEGGKMFGVLAFETPDGRVGFVRAASGQVAGLWDVPGFAPPLFDVARRAEAELPAEQVVKSFTARVDAARQDAALLAARQRLVDLEAEHARRRAELKQAHATRKAARHERRAQSTEPSLSAALDRESQADDLERRAHEARCRTERAEAQAALLPLERRLAALERLRRLISREAMRRIWDSYVLTSFSGRRVALRELFTGDPPSGAADCAAPRLLDAVRREGWKPLALAEFWWGAPPPGGARVEGQTYPACREKCGPVLPFLLEGLDVAPRVTWKPPPRPEPLRVVHADPRFVVVDKPEGLLSVPARDEAITDDVQSRLRATHPAATAVHRLDLDTSGLLLVALDEEFERLLRRAFETRAVEKTYVAVLDGELRGESGVVELPLLADVDQRPLQKVDEEHGKPAVTQWRVLSREAGRTRVELVPLTGRTHQLRLHAAHPRGLGMAIVGDRLYGRAGPRLLLHAARLSFEHPLTGARVTLESSPPF
ncbi:MAG: pseudouridine synthase [Myxococcaceae bacterium]